MEGEKEGLVIQEDIQGVVAIGGQTFDIKRVLMQLLPTLMALVTEYLTTGKISGKGRDLKMVRALLEAILSELDHIIGE